MYVLDRIHVSFAQAHLLVILLEPFYYNDQFVALFTKLIAPRKLMSIEGGAYNIKTRWYRSIVRVCEKHLFCKFL